MNLRLGRLALTVNYDRAYRGCSVHQWSWQGRRSWTHGTAYLWRFKFIYLWRFKFIW